MRTWLSFHRGQIASHSPEVPDMKSSHCEMLQIRWWLNGIFSFIWQMDVWGFADKMFPQTLTGRGIKLSYSTNCSQGTNFLEAILWSSDLNLNPTKSTQCLISVCRPRETCHLFYTMLSLAENQTSRQTLPNFKHYPSHQNIKCTVAA